MLATPAIVQMADGGLQTTLDVDMLTVIVAGPGGLISELRQTGDQGRI